MAASCAGEGGADSNSQSCTRTEEHAEEGKEGADANKMGEDVEWAREILTEPVKSAVILFSLFVTFFQFLD